MRAGWGRDCGLKHKLIDPMCGSATFSWWIAAMMSLDIAPGLGRQILGL